MATSAMDDLIGKTIKGYELRKRYGKGRYGAVYLAYHTSIQRDVVLKIIPPELANEPQFIHNFDISAQKIACLEHPHIVPLLDYWRDPEGAFLVRRHLRVMTLAQRLQEGPIPPQDVVEMVDQIASALAVAHRAGILHRNLTLNNILLDQIGTVYIADFSVLGLESSSGYTPQTDISNLGTILYAMLTGHTLAKPLPNIRKERPDLPEAINEVIQKATSPTMQDNYSDIRAVAHALHRAFDIVDVPDTEQIVNPYKGLRAFKEADAADFYGRSALTQQLIERLQGQERLLAVVAASGGGKSSLIQAGLLPALRPHHFIVQMTPGSDPLRQLEAALLGVAVSSPVRLYELFHTGDEGLLWAVNRIMADLEGDLLLVIDQFEEVFTLVQDMQIRMRFLTLLQVASSAIESRLRVVLALRAEYIGQALHYRHFAEMLQQHMVFVLPMTEGELARAITGPVQQVGMQFEADLIPVLIEDAAAQPLPLVQFALTELFRQQEDKRLTLAAYQKMGSIAGALARRADAVYEALAIRHQAIARQIFLKLTWPHIRRVNWAELADLVEQRDDLDVILDAFGYHGFVTSGADPITREPTVEITHEVLAAEWSRLGAWLDNAHADARLQQVLADEAHRWQQAKRKPDLLLRGVRLQQFKEWALSTDLFLTALERDFLEASHKASIEIQHQQLVQDIQADVFIDQRRRTALIVGIAFMVILVTMAVWSINMR